jgi:hypothetical protein
MGHGKGIFTLETFGEDIPDPGQFHDDAHGTTGDHTGPRGSRPQYNPGGPKFADGVKRDGFVQYGNRYQVPFGIGNGFLDGQGHFPGFPFAQPDSALFIAYHDCRGEAKVLATFDNLGDPSDRNDFLFKYFDIF